MALKASSRSSLARPLSLRSAALIFDYIRSMGSRSGLYGGRNHPEAPNGFDRFDGPACLLAGQVTLCYAPCFIDML
jgi:hypothetical protein